MFLLTLKIFYVYLWCRIKFVSGWIFSHKLSIYCISVHEVCFQLPPPPKPSNLDQVAYFALVYHFYAIKTIILSVFFDRHKPWQFKSSKLAFIFQTTSRYVNLISENAQYIVLLCSQWLRFFLILSVVVWYKFCFIVKSLDKFLILFLSLNTISFIVLCCHLISFFDFIVVAQYKFCFNCVVSDYVFWFYFVVTVGDPDVFPSDEDCSFVNCRSNHTNHTCCSNDAHKPVSDDSSMYV